MSITNNRPLADAYVASYHVAALALDEYVADHLTIGDAEARVPLMAARAERDAARDAWLASDEERSYDLVYLDGSGHVTRGVPARPSTLSAAIRADVEVGDWPTDEGTWESFIDVTGSGFHADAYGGDCEVFIASSVEPLLLLLPSLR